MDTASINPANKPSTGGSRRPLWLALSILVVILLLGAAMFVYWNKDRLSLGPAKDLMQVSPIERFGEVSEALELPNDQKIAVVGKETLYGEDFNYILSNFFRSEAVGATVSGKLKQKVLSQAVRDSVILQMAQAQKLIPTDQPGVSPYFNALGKDMTYRQGLVNQSYDALSDNQKVTSGEFISVWFHNNTDPGVPVEQADAQAKKWIEDLRKKITAGSMTFQQAADEIKANADWAKVDPMYKQNAYSRFVMVDGEPAFVYPAINEAIANLRPGQVSNVVRVPSSSIKPGGVGEEFYALVRADGVTNPNGGNFEEEVQSFGATLNVRYLI